MSTGTKIFLAVFAAFVGVLVVYYGVLLPEAQTLPALSPATRDGGKAVGDSTATSDGGAPVDLSGPGTGSGDFTSGGGFRFDLPSQVTPNEPTQHAPADPLVGVPPQMPAISAVTPQASTSAAPSSQPPSQSSGVEPQPQTQPAPVVSAPVANQPVSLPGTSRTARAGESKPVQLQPPLTSHYVVKSGDTMSSIAEEWFGDANKWSLIARENPNVDPARLSVGQKLRLPFRDAKPSSVPVAIKEPNSSSGSSTGAATYTVRSGDTLAKISREHFGDVAKWKSIYDANKAVIGSDPAALKPGMKLKLPPK